MKAAALVAVVVIALAAPALAAPGDPRLIQGILEWPQSLDRYPVLLIRGDDGTLYYANIGSAERRGSPSAGTRVAILGVEGKQPNEVLAVLVTTTTVADRTASGAPSASHGMTGTAPAEPASAAPAPASGADAGRMVPGGVVGTSTVPAAPAQPAPPQPTTPQAVPPQAVPPATAALQPAPAPPASPQAGSVAPANSSTAPAAGPNVAEPLSTAPALTAASPRWTEVRGVVVAVGPSTLVLKADDGQRVIVDLSALSPDSASSALIGSLVKVYGVPIEQRLKAGGFIETVGRPR